MFKSTNDNGDVQIKYGLVHSNYLKVQVIMETECVTYIYKKDKFVIYE